MWKLMKPTALTLAALMFSGAAAYADGMVTDPDGMTLYVFDKDTDGVSTCYDDCAKKWPAYVAKEGDTMAEKWTMVDRTDGTKQWAFDGKPVYHFDEDKAKGDIKGDGVGGFWHVIKQ